MTRARTRSAGRLIVLAAALATLAQAGAALAEERLALVIGNSAYRSIQALGNPANDARLVGQRLREVGFEVDTIEDADLPAMKAGLRAFSDRVGRAKDVVALLYYAGHGIQDDKNRNYLIPVDARLQAQADLVDGAVRVDYVQELLEDARPRISFLILDACRDNPLPATSRSGGRGLAPIDSRGRGTFIAFSTAPGQVALDGDPDDNSPYAAALAAEIAKPAASFEETFRRAHLQVMTSTNGRQIPWKSSSVVEEFSFVAPPGPAAEAAPAAPSDPVPVPPPAAETAREAMANLDDPDLEYQEAVLADSIEEYERFLQRFPKHARRDTVVKLIQLKREDMLWRQIEQEPDANRQLRLLDRMINAFADGAYLDRAKRRRADLIERLNPLRPPPSAPQAATPPPPQAAMPPPAVYFPPPAPRAPSALSSPPPRASSPVQTLAGIRWAIGKSANCALARKSYRLASLGNTIRWQDGTGNIDVEDIVASSATSLSTVTVRSVRAQGSGMAPGTRWTYDLSDPSLVRVFPSGKNPFVLVPCR